MQEIEILGDTNPRKCVFIDAELHHQAKVAATVARSTLRDFVEAALQKHMKENSHGSGAEKSTP